MSWTITKIFIIGTTQNTYQFSEAYSGAANIITEVLKLNGKIVLKKANHKSSDPNIKIEWKELDLNLLGTQRQKLGNYMKSTLNTIKVLTVKDIKNKQNLFKGHVICHQITEFRGNITP